MPILLRLPRLTGPRRFLGVKARRGSHERPAHPVFEWPAINACAMFFASARERCRHVSFRAPFIFWNANKKRLFVPHKRDEKPDALRGATQFGPRLCDPLSAQVLAPMPSGYNAPPAAGSTRFTLSAGSSGMFFLRISAPVFHHLRLSVSYLSGYSSHHRRSRHCFQNLSFLYYIRKKAFVKKNFWKTPEQHR